MHREQQERQALGLTGLNTSVLDKQHRAFRYSQLPQELTRPRALAVNSWQQRHGGVYMRSCSGCGGPASNAAYQ